MGLQICSSKNTPARWRFSIMHACVYTSTDVNRSFSFFSLYPARNLSFSIHSEETLSLNGACSLNPPDNSVAYLSSKVYSPSGWSSCSHFSTFPGLEVYAFLVSVRPGAKTCYFWERFWSSSGTTTITSSSTSSLKNLLVRLCVAHETESSAFPIISVSGCAGAEPEKNLCTFRVVQHWQLS